MRDLTKWPLLVVEGDRVTGEQANEILIRTNSWMYGCNDKAWERTVGEIVGLPAEPDYYRLAPDDFAERMRLVNERQAIEREFNEALGILDLEYLYNQRIMSAWIGGPKGWCDWDGQIACNTYNIGKYPDSSEVEAEWAAIAEAFPYLRLRAQLFPDEGEVITPAVEYRVAEGRVEVVVAPTDVLTGRPDNSIADDFIDQVRFGFRPGRERGVSVERLVAAVEQVRATRGN